MTTATDVRTCIDCTADICERHWRSVRCAECQREVELRAMAAKPRAVYAKACPQCGAGFTTRVKTQTTCSRRCGGLAGHPSDVELACRVCSRPFTISAQHAAAATCSRPCARWARLHPGRTKSWTCGRCRAPIARKNINAEFCTQLCAHIAGRARRDGRELTVPRVFCLSCGARIIGRTASALFCRRGCQAQAAKNRRAAKVAGARVERVYPIDIYERDEWTCHLCSAPIDAQLTDRYDPMRVSLDHIIAVAAPDFPGHLWENLAAAHLRCNIVKGVAVTSRDRALYARLAAQRLEFTPI